MSEDFIIYKVQVGLSVLQYVLKEAAEEESLRGHSKVTDALIQKVGEWQIPDDNVICKLRDISTRVFANLKEKTSLTVIGLQVELCGKKCRKPTGMMSFLTRI